jgi:hypothetical protein
MKWPESHRLTKKTRENKERFDKCIQSYDTAVISSKREDLLLDLFPYLRSLDRRLKINLRRNLQVLCDFPLKSKMIIEELNVGEELESDHMKVNQSLINQIED